jgi:cytochrome c553
MSARSLAVALFVGSACACALPAFAADPEAPQVAPPTAAETVKSVCAACHGADGNSVAPDFPRLAGQHPDYLAKALRDYKSGKRKNAIMAGMVATLTPRQIEELAAYYGAQPAVLVDKY